MITLENVFVDTSAWMALADTDDDYHTQATKILPSVLKDFRNVLTSNLVIAESYILILHELGYKASQEFLNNITASPRVRVIYSTQEVEEDAKLILKKYADQDFSYTDAVSFAIMNKHKTVKAFTFDKHFTTAGFTRIP